MRSARAHRPPTTVPGLPDVNTTVVLELHPQGLLLPTRVEDHVSSVLLVSAAGHRGTLEARQRVTLGWAFPRGACSVVCELVEVVAGSPPLWALLPVGPVQRSQRRRYVRGALLGSAELAPRSADLAAVLATDECTDGATGQCTDECDEPSAGRPGPSGELLPARVPGELVDVCEGGAQVRTAGEGAGVLVGDEVRLVLGFAGRRAELVARVVRNRPLASGGRLVGLVFDADDATADAIRGEVLRAQVAGRAREDSSW